jgi:hypothetical protein
MFIRANLRPCGTFHDMLLLERGVLNPLPDQTSCQLSTTTYLIQSQFLSIYGGHILHPQPEDVLYCGGNGPIQQTMSKITVAQFPASCYGKISYNYHTIKM